MSNRVSVRGVARLRAGHLRTALLVAIGIVAIFANVSAPIVTATTSGSYYNEAASAFSAFMNTYWDPGSDAFYSRSDHEARVGGKVSSPFWWTAQLWDTVLDDYERTHSSTDRSLIDTVYNGFVARFPTFSSNYNDDRGWWALASTRAYVLTGEARYLTRAISLADDQWSYWDSTFGGGLWWRRSVHDQKNVATNAPAAITDARLYHLTGRLRFLRHAVAEFNWVDTKLRSGGRLDDRYELPNNRIVVDYSYNYGTYVGAALALNSVTGDSTYIERATSLANSAMSRLTSGGVLRNEGEGDGGGFKGIFVRNLAALARSSAVGASSRATYASFLAHNADVAWAHRTGRRLWGGDWTVVTWGPIEVLTDMSAVALFEVTSLTH
jgi:predicted alpha-1,6-mannanase (GH76 family)